MAVGALIGAYQEDDSGALRALLPLAGRTLLEYQVRCAAAAGAAPIVVIVERVPQALQDAFERLRLDSIGVFPVSDINEAISRFEAGSSILLIADGIAPSVELVTRMAGQPEPAVAIVPDDEEHQAYERIDAGSRWAGVAMADARLLGSTAAMLGDWDVQSTLLRRAIQEGALRIQAAEAAGEPLMAESADQLAGFQRVLIKASRGARTDFASRYLLAPIEDFATERLMETPVRPPWLVWASLVFTLGGAFCFTRGWLGAGLVLLVLSTPLDLIAGRLASLRLKPLPVKMLSPPRLVARGRHCLACDWTVGDAPRSRLGGVGQPPRLAASPKRCGSRRRPCPRAASCGSSPAAMRSCLRSRLRSVASGPPICSGFSLMPRFPSSSSSGCVTS